MTSINAELIADPVGCYPAATVACFDPTRGRLPRRQLDTERTVAYLERLADLGVGGFLIASSTGQGHLRTVEELDEWYRCTARADTQRALRMALLRPEDGRTANLRLLDLLAESGFSVIFLRPGTDMSSDANDACIAESLSPLVEAAAARGFAVGLYSIPDVSGMPLTPRAAAMLAEGPGGDHVVAIKVTERDYQGSTLRFLEAPALAKLKIVQGWDPHLARALRDGPRFDPRGRQRTGITSGLMALAVYQYLHLLAAAAAADWEEVAVAQAAVDRMFAAMQDDPGRFADLQRAKYVMGLGHPLTATVKPEHAERIFDALESVPRDVDRERLARSLDLMGDGPFHERLRRMLSAG